MAKMNEQLPNDWKLMLQFSEGWLSKFKTCHNLQSFKTHGESRNADNSVLEMELLPLVEKISCYPPENVYNADETALSYNAAPDRTYARECPGGQKKEKSRLTLLLCANATGLDKLPLLFIGKSKSPRAFKRKTPAILGVQYFYNTKSWMTLEFFESGSNSLTIVWQNQTPTVKPPPY